MADILGSSLCNPTAPREVLYPHFKKKKKNKQKYIHTPTKDESDDVTRVSNTREFIDKLLDYLKRNSHNKYSPLNNIQFGSSVDDVRMNPDAQNNLEINEHKKQKDLEHRIQQENGRRVKKHDNHIIQEDNEYRIQEQDEYRIQEHDDNRIQEQNEYKVQEHDTHRIEHNQHRIQIHKQSKYSDSKLTHVEEKSKRIHDFFNTLRLPLENQSKEELRTANLTILIKCYLTLKERVLRGTPADEDKLLEALDETFPQQKRKRKQRIKDFAQRKKVSCRNVYATTKRVLHNRTRKIGKSLKNGCLDWSYGMLNMSMPPYFNAHSGITTMNELYTDYSYLRNGSSAMNNYFG